MTQASSGCNVNGLEIKLLACLIEFGIIEKNTTGKITILLHQGGIRDLLAEKKLK